jgi:hypothetical protein
VSATPAPSLFSSRPSSTRPFTRPRGARGLLAAWMRAACRQRARVPLAFVSGYAEGKSAAWSDVNARVRAALERAFE